MTQLAPCRGFTKAGQPCQMVAGADGWCFNHRPDPEAAEARREARSRGGSVGKAHTLDQVDVRFESAPDVTRLLANICQWVLTGQVDAKTANSAVYAASAALRAFAQDTEATEPDTPYQVAQRLADFLEEQAERMEMDSIRALVARLRHTETEDETGYDGHMENRGEQREVIP
ncbi:MAG: hypothetical protein HYW07_17695 [Candidatus Latescibacteria bacterium]|nr:hypothetical protein [Candidatus Latescibacterota bacterium]